VKLQSWMYRTLTFIIAVPAVVAVIIFDYGNHLAANLVIIAASAIGTMEVGDFFRKAGYEISAYLLPIYGAILPLSTYLEIIEFLPKHTFSIVFTIIISLIFIRQIFWVKEKQLTLILSRIAANITVVVYPGFFFAFITRLTGLNHPTAALLTICLIVFANDTFAYILGMLFGRDTKNVTPISPNKSLTGFISGIVAGMGVAYISYLFSPGLYQEGGLILALILGFVLSLTAIIGDLIESAMKRSVDKKDSGTIIPGRGGILDSVDSLILCAPLFYYILFFIGG